MPVKHFIISPNKTEIPKERIEKSRQEEEFLIKTTEEVLNKKSIEKIEEEDNLIHVENRVIVKVDIEFKNWHQFENGLKIRRERKYNEFNRRITEPVNAIVISGEGIPRNAEMLIDHNALHESNRINDYKNSFEHADSDRIRYFSIPLYECYAWREGTGKWQPIYPFEFGLRVFKPYKGFLQGIDPTQIKDVLYCTSGEYAGKVLKVLLACDYQIIFNDTNMQENYLIVFRPNGEEKTKREPEAVAIMEELTEQVNKGELLVGYEIKDAKPVNLVHND